MRFSLGSRFMRLLSPFVTLLLLACAPLSTHANSIEPWLGCYRLQFAPSDTNDLDSVRLVAKYGPASPGWTVIPNSALSEDRLNPGARTWHWAGDTLVIQEGLLSSYRIALTQGDSVLTGTAALRSDVLECRRDGTSCRDPNAMDWKVTARRGPCPGTN
jgi:hypothetical protein